MDSEANVQVVLRYFDACGSGDLDALMSTLRPDVVHCFLSPEHRPIRGAEHLARYWRKFHQVYSPIWRVDHTIAAADEVVAGWSCSYIPKGRDYFRGTEWYVVRDGRIAEERAYYQYDERRDCELTGFPYAERGYLAKGQAR